MSIAMEDNKLNILRYLVVEKQMSVYETKDLNLALGMLDSVLKMSPDDSRSDEMMASNDYYTENEHNGYAHRQDYKRTQQIPEQLGYENEIERNLRVLEQPSTQQFEIVETSKVNEENDDQDEDDDDKTVTTISDAVSLSLNLIHFPMV